MERSALVAVDDATGRRQAVVCVELREGVDRAAVISELDRLAKRTDATGAVDRVVAVDHIPVDRRHNAKIDRPRLGAQLTTGRR